MKSKWHQASWITQYTYGTDKCGVSNHYFTARGPGAKHKMPGCIKLKFGPPSDVLLASKADSLNGGKRDMFSYNMHREYSLFSHLALITLSWSLPTSRWTTTNMNNGNFGRGATFWKPNEKLFFVISLALWKVLRSRSLTTSKRMSSTRSLNFVKGLQCFIVTLTLYKVPVCWAPPRQPWPGLSWKMTKTPVSIQLILTSSQFLDKPWPKLFQLHPLKPFMMNYVPFGHHGGIITPIYPLNIGNGSLHLRDATCRASPLQRPPCQSNHHQTYLEKWYRAANSRSRRLGKRGSSTSWRPSITRTIGPLPQSRDGRFLANSSHPRACDMPWEMYRCYSCLSVQTGSPFQFVVQDVEFVEVSILTDADVRICDICQFWISSTSAMFRCDILDPICGGDLLHHWWTTGGNVHWHHSMLQLLA